MRRPVPIVLALLAIGAASAYADLDVGVPPGTPLDWVSGLPRRIPTGSVRIPTGVEPEPKAGEQPHTVSRGTDVPKTHVANEDLGRILPMSYARILTPDITGHLQWVNVRPPQETAEGKKTSTGKGAAAKDGPEVTVDYPPHVGEDLHWMGLAILLRKLIHPNLISDAESLHLLIGMGEAVLPPLLAAEGQGPIKPWIEVVRGEVGYFPAKKPRALQTGKTPEEKMLLRLAADDLASGYPCGLEGDFAPHLLALEPEETVPILVRYLEESDHPFLRRNACSLLGNYLGDLPTGALVKAFNETKDGVIKERAVDALARRQSTEILPALERGAVGHGLAQTLSIWALGAIGDPKASHWAVRALGHTDDPDLLWAAIPAVARSKHEKPKEAINALKTIARFLADPPEGTFEQGSMLQADVPDAPLCKATCLLEMAIIALARLGDEPAKKDLWKLLDGDAPEIVPRNRRAAAHQSPVASKGTFGMLHVPSLVLLLETLPLLGDNGRKHLETIANDTVCEVTLRLSALDGLMSMNALTVDFLDPLFKDRYFLPVRARALRYMAAVDAVEGRKRAIALLKDYPTNAIDAAGSDVVTAIQILSQDTRHPFPIKTMSAALVRAARDALESPGAGGGGNMNDRTIQTRPPILEELLAALGTSNVNSAVPVLLAHARDKKAAARASAVAALAGFPTTRGALISLLSDEDGWVRYVAYRGLHRKAPAVDGFADWIYGTQNDRAAAIDVWKAWLTDEAVKKADEAPPKKEAPPPADPKKGDEEE